MFSLKSRSYIHMFRFAVFLSIISLATGFTVTPQVRSTYVMIQKWLPNSSAPFISPPRRLFHPTTPSTRGNVPFPKHPNLNLTPLPRPSNPQAVKSSSLGVTSKSLPFLEVRSAALAKPCCVYQSRQNSHPTTPTPTNTSQPPPRLPQNSTAPPWSATSVSTPWASPTSKRTSSTPAGPS